MKGILFEHFIYGDDGGYATMSKHTLDDWGLLLASADIPPAIPKTTYIDIPGGHGTIDLSEVNGGLKYKDRECTFIFYMNLSDGTSDEAYEAKRREILGLIDGREFQIYVDDVKDRHLVGRCWLDEWSSDKRVRKFVIVAKTKPFWFKNEPTFDGKRKEYGTAVSFRFMNEGVAVKPTISCSSDLKIEHSVGSYMIVEHTIKCNREEFEPVFGPVQHDIVFQNGENRIDVLSEMGSGWIEIEFTERGL